MRDGLSLIVAAVPGTERRRHLVHPPLGFAKDEQRKATREGPDYFAQMLAICWCHGTIAITVCLATAKTGYERRRSVHSDMMGDDLHGC